MFGLLLPTAAERSASCARVALALIALLMVAALAGCERETTPPLIQVLSVSPREVEEGDRITIEGVGFPEGKTAHIAFRGDLHRPGVAAVPGVEVDVDALVASGSEIDVPVTAALEQLFVGPGDHAAHTTFSGDVTIAFAARSPAAPPVAGTLRDIWVDVRPPLPRHALLDGEAAEGERTLSFLGIKAQAAPVPAGGILIESVGQGSRAERARLLSGDVVTEMNGVRVLSMRDLVVAPNDRAPWLKIRRAGSPNEELATVSLLGFKPPAAAAMLTPVVGISFAAILLLLFFAPTPGVVAWLERSIAARFGARPGPWADVVSSTASLSRVVAVGASLMFAFLPFAHYLGLGDVDAGLLFLASLTALVTLAACTGGARRERPYSVVAGLGAAGQIASLGVPVAASLVAVVMMTGSLRLEDLVHAQAGWPWGWMVFRTPLLLLLFGLSSLSVLARAPAEDLPLVDAAAPALDASLERGVAPADARGRLLFFATWAHRLVLSALAAALFLGGWQLPGLAHEQMEAQLGWTTLGALLYVAKVWLVVAALVLAEHTLPRVRRDQAMALCWRWLAPLSIAAALLTALWVAWGPGPSVETLVGSLMVALACAGALHVATRVRFFRRERGGGLDPFI